MAIVSYWPEMGQAVPANTDGDVRSSHASGYLIKTPHTLKGRGVKLLRVFKSEDLIEQAQHKVGWNEYRVSERALELLAERYTFAREHLLD